MTSENTDLRAEDVVPPVDLARSDYEFNRREAWRLDQLAGQYEHDRWSLPLRAQARATLAQAAATRLQAEQLAALTTAVHDLGVMVREFLNGLQQAMAPLLAAAERAAHPPVTVDVSADTAVVHRSPARGEAVTPCCGRSPFELIGHRITNSPDLVTCGKGEAVNPCLAVMLDERDWTVDCRRPRHGASTKHRDAVDWVDSVRCWGDTDPRALVDGTGRRIDRTAPPAERCRALSGGGGGVRCVLRAAGHVQRGNQVRHEGRGRAGLIRWWGPPTVDDETAMRREFGGE